MAFNLGLTLSSNIHKYSNYNQTDGSTEKAAEYFEKHLDELNTRGTEILNECILRFMLIVHAHPCCTCKFMMQCQGYQRNPLNT